MFSFLAMDERRDDDDYYDDERLSDPDPDTAENGPFKVAPLGRGL